jgi:hypothetical protein
MHSGHHKAHPVGKDRWCNRWLPQQMRLPGFHPEQNAENGYVTGPHFSNEGMNGMRVTHWMPLPKPPCGAKMDGGKAE